MYTADIKDFGHPPTVASVTNIVNFGNLHLYVCYLDNDASVTHISCIFYYYLYIESVLQ